MSETAEASSFDLPALLATLRPQPRLAVVLGSGLGGLVDDLELLLEVPLRLEPGIQAALVAGHALTLKVVRWGTQSVVVQVGRYHLYQGLTGEQLSQPVQLMAEAGIERVVFTNAAGALNPDYDVGDLMLIEDHINLPGLAGHGPLIPPIGDQVSFLSLRDAYSPRLRQRLRAAATTSGVTLRAGVYVYVAGPSYETPAELRALRLLGGDAVGMSTVPEVIRARSTGLEVAAISVITNLARPEVETHPSHQEVLRESQRAATRLRQLLDRMVASETEPNE